MHDSVTMYVVYIFILGHVGLGIAFGISILISIVMCGVIIVQCYMIRSQNPKRQM